MKLSDLGKLLNSKLIELMNDKSYNENLRRRIDSYNNDDDRHRVYAHGQIDMRLEAGLITPEQAIELKREWDSRH